MVLNKELTAGFTTFYQALLIMLQLRSFIEVSSSSLSPRGSKFSISLTSIHNGENIRF